MTAFDQSFYQVRLDWGAAGLARLEPSDVVVVVDVLTAGGDAADAAARGEDFTPGRGDGLGAVADRAGGALVLAAGLRNASAVARAIVAEQHRRGARVSVSVVPLGQRAGDGRLRFAVEDQLGAGAVIAALGDAGTDHTSPDAAVAGEAFRALRGAVRHMLAAGGSGQELTEHGRHDRVAHAAETDAVDAVPVWRDGAFRPL